jgi:cell division septal protein FtsQ
LPLRKKILFTGAALFLAGGALMTWFVIKRHSGAGDWQIAVEGNRILTEKEIQEVVGYLLHAAKDGVSSDEIRDALLLNSRIASAKATVLPVNIGRDIAVAANS